MKQENLHKVSFDMASEYCPVYPRFFVVLTFIYVVFVSSFSRYSLSGLICMASFPVFLSVYCGVNLSGIIRKMLMASPFIIFMAIWSPVFDSGRMDFIGYNISCGWLSFVTLLIKFFLTVSATLIMITVLGFDRFCRTLSAFGVPDVLVTQMMLMNRYVALIVDESRNVVRSRLFRCGKITISEAGNICGPLLLRSINRAYRINEALECRSFGGRLYNHHEGHNMSFGDAAFFVVWIFLFSVIRFVNFSIWF